jgi:hypothetical protein
VIDSFLGGTYRCIIFIDSLDLGVEQVVGYELRLNWSIIKLTIIEHLDNAFCALDSFFRLPTEPNPHAAIRRLLLYKDAINNALILTYSHNLVFDVREEVEVHAVNAIVEHVREQNAR